MPSFNLPGGSTGNPGGLTYKFNTSVAVADPGAGRFSFNTTNIGTATLLWISETDDLGNGIAALLATWDDGTSTIRGRVRAFDPASPARLP